MIPAYRKGPGKYREFYTHINDGKYSEWQGMGKFRIFYKFIKCLSDGNNLDVILNERSSEGIQYWKVYYKYMIIHEATPVAIERIYNKYFEPKLVFIDTYHYELDQLLGGC